VIKKISNIILAIILLVSTTGFTLSKHYCGGKLESVEVNAEAESCCDSPYCCHTETEFNKLSVEFLSSATEVQVNENKSYQLVDLFEYVVSDTKIASPQKHITLYLKILPDRIFYSPSLFQNFRL